MRKLFPPGVHTECDCARVHAFRGRRLSRSASGPRARPGRPLRQRFLRGFQSGGAAVSSYAIPSGYEISSMYVPKGARK